MKCPHCKKDVSDDWKGDEEKLTESLDNPLFYQILECHHCDEIIFFLYKGLTSNDINCFYTPYSLINRSLNAEEVEERKRMKELIDRGNKLVFQYPFLKTTFEIPDIPKKIKVSLNEGEKCFCIGSNTGTAACLRKCIYLLCDNRKVEGDDYAEKIENLFSETSDFSDLCKQIKWLGDKHVHGDNKETYSKEDIEQAIKIVPVIIEEIYGKDFKVKNAKNLLNKKYQKTK